MSNQAMIYCKLQNRLGAMDRVLSAFTHRGILPTRFVSTHDEKNRAVEMVVTFDCTDSVMLDKLVKFLQKQVYVLETHTLSQDSIPSDGSEAAEQVKTLESGLLSSLGMDVANFATSPSSKAAATLLNQPISTRI